ncbi:MAG TPA: DUF3108 domain-containing protein [Myxococcus sp.]|nr:DUF3108 domain-containing protein [Myxococcus sp.]
MNAAPLRQKASQRAAALLGAALLAVSAPALAQQAERPFAAGEALPYAVKLGSLGGDGTGHLRVEEAAPLRGEPVVLLRFDFETRVGPFKVKHHSRSWLSTTRMASLRYEVDEQAPVGEKHDQVELFPETRRWEGRRGQGISPSAEPLDELSFLYALRTLPLAPGHIYRLERHYDAKRNPVKVRVLRREPLSVPAGTFDTILVEMEVSDPDRYGGQGVLRLHLTDDARRLPVRIESKVPMAGELVLQLLPVAVKPTKPEATP